MKRSQTKLNWYPVMRHLAQLGGFDSEFRLFSRGDVSRRTDMIVLESVILWESASLAGRAIQELWLLRAGQMALTSIDPLEATLSALRRDRPQSRD
ncbi:hypothetical protein PJL15_00713 [Paenarthrobacter nitroguajacolicus]|nr:hypothetical protein [Paenarthrobacter nitroguajacolicus]